MALMRAVSNFASAYVMNSFVLQHIFPSQVAPNDEAALPCVACDQVFKNEEEMITHLETDHYDMI